MGKYFSVGSCVQGWIRMDCCTMGAVTENANSTVSGKLLAVWFRVRQNSV
jgi:hypothetical protein